MDFITQNLNYIWIAGGLFGLFIGGEALVRGAIAVAEGLKVPKLIVGLTIVGFGTSMPELLVSLQSVHQGAGNIAIGNIIGSNIANLLLILGLGALIYPLSTSTRGLRRDALFMTVVSAALVGLACLGVISPLHGLIMVGVLLAYLLAIYLFEPKLGEDNTQPKPRLSPLAALGWMLAGLVLLIGGADFLVRGATAIARDFGVSDAVIGLTLVAVGTSLPEITVTVLSAIRRQGDVALGNALGSNIFNILGILGITAMVSPLPIPPGFLYVDLPVLMGSALLILYLILRKKPIGRLTGLLCLLAYATYTAWLIGGETALATVRPWLSHLPFA